MDVFCKKDIYDENFLHLYKKSCLQQEQNLARFFEPQSAPSAWCNQSLEK
jgi:hypothetical protein